MRWFGVALVGFVIAIPFTAADEKATVDVEVQVTDLSSAEDEGVEGAWVTLRDEEGKEYTDDADESGLVIVDEVPFGEYTMVVSADGFRDTTRKIEVSQENSSFSVKLPRDDRGGAG